MSIRVLSVGLGPIGLKVANLLVERQGFELVGGVDLDSAKQGQDLRELLRLGPSRPMGTGGPAVPVMGDLDAALAGLAPEAAVVCTGSALARVAPTFEACLAAGAAVVSTTEELAYPWYHQPELARRLDAAASNAGRALLGTGVNPGFAMDTLPLSLTAVCERVDTVTVRRVQDAGRRRLPFQRKIGAGLTPEAFRERVAKGEIRHVGLPESVAMIAGALGWELDSIDETIEPKLAENPLASDELSVEAGQACGLVQVGTGRQGDRVRIRLEFEAWIGAPASYDEVEIEGLPSLRSRIEGGIHGDIATAAVVVNAIERVLAAPPGLVTMNDLPPAVCRG